MALYNIVMINLRTSINNNIIPNLWIRRNKTTTLLDDGVIVTLGRTVGENCVVGAGAVVTKDTNPNMVIYGNPAREIRTNENIGK